MASARKINVRGKQYLQVVEYSGGRIDVLKSFGADNQENWLRAVQFAENYNAMEKIAKEEAEEGGNLEDLLIIAGGVFGFILGATMVEKIINKYKRKEMSKSTGDDNG